MSGHAGRWFGSLLVALFSFILLSCGGQGGSGTPGDTGTLQVSLTDLPSAAYTSVVITVTQIEVFAENGNSGILVLNNPVSVNVLDYKDYALRIGQGKVPAATYSQLRLVLAENPDTGDPVNFVTLNCDELPGEPGCDSDKKWPMKTPSGHTSGLKLLLVDNLVVNDRGVALLTIDFAPDTAIVERGDWDPLRHDDKERFLIKPTGINIIQDGVDTTYGVLFGEVVIADDPDSGPVAVVVAINPDTLDPVAAALVNPSDEPGAFRFFLDAGDYDLEVKAEGYQPVSDGPFAVSESDVDPRPKTDAGTFILEPLGVDP